VVFMSSTKSIQSPHHHHDEIGDYNSTTSSPSFDRTQSLKRTPSFQYDASLHPLDIAASKAYPTIASPLAPTPVSAGLRLQTAQLEEQLRPANTATSADAISAMETPQQTVFNAGLPVRSSSIRSVLDSRARRSDSLSPASALSSPGVGPLVDMTPLPSPISAWGMPEFGRTSIESDIDSENTVAGQTRDSLPEPIHFVRASPKKRRIPDSLEQIYNANAAAHARNRSLSEYVPEAIQIPRSRNIVVSTSGASSIGQIPYSPPDDDHMHREQYLAVQRGLAISIPKPPTPPDSNQGRDNDEFESIPTTPGALKDAVPLVYEACMVRGGKLRKWRALRHLGKGTFSRVMLATSESSSRTGELVDQSNFEERVHSRSLVAVKICQKGPTGGADEEKIKTSIRREMELMKSICHPSLVQLKAVNEGERQTYLVLNYCAGGDLFELANSDLSILTPSLTRRMFAELVSAVRYLHGQYMVHRDIKLESKHCDLKLCRLS
jgi:protein-serine/threonine kinase